MTCDLKVLGLSYSQTTALVVLLSSCCGQCTLTSYWAILRFGASSWV